MIRKLAFLGLVAFWFAIIPQAILAQQKIPVEIIHQGNDNIGARLVYQTKERIRKSSALKLTKNEPGLILHLTSMDINPQMPGYASAIGIAVTIYSPQQPFKFFLYSGVMVCPINSITSMSEGLVAIVDDCADDYRKFTGSMP